MDWITNNPEAADKLKAAEKVYQAARAAAICLPMAEKLVALRAAQQSHIEACRAIVLANAQSIEPF
jgi:hypothetical protein